MNDRLTREQAAVWAWRLWGGLLIVHLLMLIAGAVTLGLTSGGLTGGGFGWAVGGLALAVVLGTFGRGEIFKRYWVGDAIEPIGYLLGHVWAWGLLAVAAAGGLGLCLARDALWPTAVVLLVALIMHTLMWPRRQVMHGEG
ncbi:MAG: hypothetical protein WD294_01860 [Phycisphaeraceae bacterium]